MNKKRLLRLTKFLEEELPEEKFTLDVWMASADFYAKIHGDSPLAKKAMKTRDVSKPAFSARVGSVKPVSCQTVGCAIGWATTIPEFKKAGLRLRLFPHKEEADIEYNGYTAFWAAAAFFGISDSEAINLFCPSCYPSNVKPKTIAKRIRKLVEKGERHEVGEG